MGYYLTDGIYPKWSIFVKTIPAPQEKKLQLFVGLHDFSILKYTPRDHEACIILYNIIAKDERDENKAVDFDYEQIDEVDNPPIQVSREHTNGFMVLIQSHERIRDQQIYSQHQSDLMDHLWKLHGEL